MAPAMMKGADDWIRAQCLALPDVYMDQPFGAGSEVYRIHGRMFALLTEFPKVAPGVVCNLKAEVAEVPLLIAEHPFVHPGFHMNKRHWISVSFPSGVDLELVASLIEDSYDNVRLKLPKELRGSLRPLGEGSAGRVE